MTLSNLRRTGGQSGVLSTLKKLSAEISAKLCHIEYLVTYYLYCYYYIGGVVLEKKSLLLCRRESFVKIVLIIIA
uniref:Ovule protein n=1 Tax=Strongyloides venezuelensis TaxID=75913 RepID=A0A0K0FHR3_STRVS